jgi:methanethiol S-methyltransferase
MLALFAKPILPLMKKRLFLLYGIISYFAFLGTTLYAIGFTGNLFVPRTIDGEPQTSLIAAILFDIALLLLYAWQHSMMARLDFKRWWTDIIPPELERSSFVLLSSLCLALLMWLWQPIGGVVWSVENKIAIDLLHILYLAGWGIVFISTFLINHFDMFGLRQVWLYFTGKPYTEFTFNLPGLCQLVRRPMYLGFIIAFWTTPVMTLAHLLLAALTTAYILTTILFKERDMIAHFSEKYRSYKKWAPMLITFSRKKAAK